MRTFTLPLLLLAAAPSDTLDAQDFLRRAKRSVGPYVEADAAGSELLAGALRVGPNLGSGLCRLEWAYSDPAVPLYSVELPFHRAGGAVDLGEGRYLLSGLLEGDSGPVGKLLVMQLVRDDFDLSHQLLDSADLPGIDPVSVCFNALDERLYVWDQLSDSVLSWPWAGPSVALDTAPAPAVAATRQTHSDALRHFALTALRANNLGESTFLAPKSSAWPRPRLSGFSFIDPVDRSWSQVWPDGNGGWSAQLTSSDWFLSEPSHFTLDHFAWVGGAHPFLVRCAGPASASFELVELLSGTVLHTGVATPAGTSVGPLPVLNQDAGAVYQLRSPDESLVSFDFRGAVRYGAPTDTPDLALLPGMMPVHGPDVPYEVQLGPWGVAAVVDAHGTGGALSGALWIGLRAADGGDPVSSLGAQAVLQPLVDLPFSLALDDLRSDLSHHLDFFTDDARWEGAVLLFQYAIETPSGIATTDVFGRRVRGGYAPEGGGASPTPDVESLEGLLLELYGPLSEHSADMHAALLGG